LLDGAATDAAHHRRVVGAGPGLVATPVLGGRTWGRMAHSASWLVAGTPSWGRKVNRASRSFRRWAKSLRLGSWLGRPARSLSARAQGSDRLVQLAAADLAGVSVFPQGDDDPSGGFNQYSPGISVAPDGRIDVAWPDFRNDPFFSPGAAGDMGTAADERFWDVYYASSTDGGNSWSANTRITNPSIDGDVGVTFNNNDVRGPMGIASTSKASYITWADARPSEGRTRKPRTCASTSRGSATWPLPSSPPPAATPTSSRGPCSGPPPPSPSEAWFSCS
jgi:hypothetical protein